MQFILGLAKFLGALAVIAVVLACFLFVITVAWVLRGLLVLIAVVALLMCVIGEIFSSKRRRRNTS